MKQVILAVTFLALWACDVTGSSVGGLGGDSDERGADLLTAGPTPSSVKCVWPDDSCVPNAPPLLKLENWKGDGLWPSDTTSAFTVFIESPRDAKRFWAYGIDLKKNKIIFHVEGTKGKAMAKFKVTQELQLGEFVAGGGPGIDFNDGSMLPVYRQPPAPPGPVGHDWYAYKAFQAAQGQQALGEQLYSKIPGVITQ